MRVSRKYYEHHHKREHLDEVYPIPSCGSCIKKHGCIPCDGKTRCIYRKP